MLYPFVPSQYPMMDIAQIFLLDSNLHVLFAQERLKSKRFFLAGVRKSISEALHHKTYSHLIPIEDGFTIGFKALAAFPNVFIVLIACTGNIPKNLILLNAQLDDCDVAISSFYAAGQPEWFNEIPKLHEIFNERWLHGSAALPSRKFLNISGPDAGKFLQNLSTNDVNKLSGDSGHFSALLNAQGRVMFDVFVYRIGQDFFVECDGQIQERVFLHFQTYNLRTRTKIKMVDESEGLRVVFSSVPLEGAASVAKDTRSNWNFSRYLFTSQDAASASLQSSNTSIFSEGRYNRERILRGVPEGAYEIPSRQSIPLEYNFDLMGGIDFNKGCYIGQELVTRTHNRGVVRKRILPLRFHALDPDSCKPIRTAEFEKDSPLTINLDKQNEFLPTALDPAGKLKILSTNDSIGKLIMAQGNIGLGMMRLESLKNAQNRLNMATLDHIRNDWILADAIVPDWWPITIFE